MSAKVDAMPTQKASGESSNPKSARGFQAELLRCEQERVKEDFAVLQAFIIGGDGERWGVLCRRGSFNRMVDGGGHFSPLFKLAVNNCSISYTLLNDIVGCQCYASNI